MSVLYLHTAPKPNLPGTDAVFQESEILRSRFGGNELVIYPFLNPSSYLPRFLYGWHKFLEIGKFQKEIALNHVFSPGLFHYPILKILKKPIVYSVTATLRDEDLERPLTSFRSLANILVNSERDRRKLSDRGFENVVQVPPVVNVESLKPGPVPDGQQFILLMASAPWEANQFDSKGINLLLRAVKEAPWLKLVLLWRGRLMEELQNRIQKEDVREQVEVIDELVNIQEVMDRVHATVLLAKTGEIVKSFPHSLVESVACAKPVVISDTIAMSDYVKNFGCGLVLKRFDLPSLLPILEQLRNDYSVFREAAERVGGSSFSSEHVLEKIGQVYHQINPDL
ncbi:MAG: glycosyltransferase [Saprospiraceae bacterium]|nr:glycosyltransferase [Saprospiraceae bacterium]